MIELIAEIGSVHDGSFGNAVKLIELAKEVGANAVKFQMHIAEEESLRNAPKPYYFDGEDRYSYFERTSFSILEWAKLRDSAKEIGIKFIVSPFSLEAIKRLEKLNIDAYKVASGEITNIPLLEALASLKKPVYISSGMSSVHEIDKAVNIFVEKKNIILMQCTSMYPCDQKYVGLNIINYFKEKYKINVGFSDHTVTNTAALLAYAYGAQSIEKHLTFSKKMYGSDAPYAAEPDQFKNLSMALKEACVILSNNVDKDELVEQLKDMKYVFEKSIVAKKDLEMGDELMFEDLAFKKPAGGLKPSEYKDILGKKLKNDLKKDEFIKKEDFFN